MPKRLSLNIGFITNSSFAVHHFPRQLLEHPEVKAFIETFEISQGFVGENLWYRSKCGTVAMTQEQKQEVLALFDREPEFHPPRINTESDDVLIIYGDEHVSVARRLSRLMQDAAEAMGLSYVRGEYH
jgi:hypothetical protein